ncbi:MAG: 3-phosphoshikimate 1-carboxyvinyltransferase, partial [Candidatus Promineifilaceae bacterium]|nr:3-phosphoshikimate 1-carboxyvinyltransferase [Candidatus Promineifilaceae bacterium]
MTTLIVQPQQTSLQGSIELPGDKSISHRAVMLAALAEGTSQISRWLPAGDTQATLEVIRDLGVDVSVTRAEPGSWDIEVIGRGLHGWRAPAGALNCRNAGTCMRLLAGILAGQSFATVLDGSVQLRGRPMARIINPLQQMGAAIAAEEQRAPLHISPAPLRAMRYELPLPSAQVKSAILLAGLYAAGRTQVYEPGPARDHSERMLQAMGAPLHSEGGWITVNGPVPALKPLEMAVPGDISSAAFPLVAAALVPDSTIRLENVGVNWTRTGLVEILSSMGAAVDTGHLRTSGGEPLADLMVGQAPLAAIEVSGDVVVRAIDELPVWAVAATQAQGSSRLRDAAELRVKEVDRISRVAGELRKLGAQIEEHPDGMTVHGPAHLQGAPVDSHGDPRLGMALAVAALVA